MLYFPHVTSAGDMPPRDYILHRCRLFENFSVCAVQIDHFGGLILRPLSWPFWKRSTLGLPSIFGSASEPPPWTSAVPCLCEVYYPVPPKIEPWI